MLKINGKVFMNLQEAVQWLLDNNALPFQSSANYIANTEIGMGTIVNPSPAKVRIGSLIFFADSKVSTVTGLTENGFIVSDQYNDLVDDVVYVSNVEIDANAHLVVTLSNGNTIDAGLIREVANVSIDASQHLVVSYNDGTSDDLGAIYSGNITISGNLTVTGSINGESSPSLKPIYYHPIYVYQGITTNIKSARVSFVILNNDGTAFTNSTFRAKAKELMDNGAYLQCNGHCIASTDVNYDLFLAIKTGGTYKVLGNDYQGNNADFDFDEMISGGAFNDGVNKIN